MKTRVDIDCTGLKCPEPVMRTRRALESAGAPFTVLVDNETARDNVNRFAGSSGCAVEARPVPGGFLLTVTPGIDGRVEAAAPLGEPGSRPRDPAGAGTVLLVSSDTLGGGERELGMNLMRSFLYAASEAEITPSAVVFLNSGVRLVTEDEQSAGHVSRLEERGAEVITCGTCLDYYGLKNDLKAGRVGNMYEIQELLIGAGKLVSI